MEQFNVPNEKKVNINYSDKDLPASVKIFQPVVFKDGDLFCVVLGPDAHQGVSGYGNTLQEAIMSWDKGLQQRVMDHDDGDEVVKFIVQKLKSYKVNSNYPYISQN
jgi:hypothetical protein